MPVVHNDQHYFYDVEDFEEIIDYYLQNKDLKRARTAIELAVNQHPQSLNFTLKQAIYFSLAGNSDRAFETLAKAEKIDPTNADIFITRGGIYSQMSKSEKAIYSFGLNRSMIFASTQ